MDSSEFLGIYVISVILNDEHKDKLSDVETFGALMGLISNFPINHSSEILLHVGLNLGALRAKGLFCFSSPFGFQLTNIFIKHLITWLLSYSFCI